MITVQLWHILMNITSIICLVLLIGTICKIIWHDKFLISRSTRRMCLVDVAACIGLLIVFTLRGAAI